MSNQIIPNDGYADGGEPYTDEEMALMDEPEEGDTMKTDVDYTEENQWFGDVNFRQDEPEEDDICTEDYMTWYQYGKLVFRGDEEAFKEWYAKQNFKPDAWFISDHGNAHRITL